MVRIRQRNGIWLLAETITFFQTEVNFQPNQPVDQASKNHHVLQESSQTEPERNEL